MRSICSLALAIVVSSACDGAAPVTSPTSPGPTPSAPTVYTLSGAVTELTPSGSTPVEGALVRDDFGQQTATDAGGAYTLTRSLAGPGTSAYAVTISKAGYTTIRSTVVLTAGVRLDVRLNRIITFTLSGTVFEATPAGRVPVGGVSLYCDGCGSPDGHTYTDTDANGNYRFEWTPNGAMPLWVTKAGYALASNQPLGPMTGYIVPIVEGDTRFDIELVRR